MMIGRDEAADDNATKQEAGGDEHEKTNTKAPSSSAIAGSSSSWSRLKDPRIVRVSKAFGGKDRHSKVCTVRGLRDRRVRLSVPTAIQLYDLQDRLGLNQPSKVVDWLLDAAKHEIDELPPLQMPPPGNLISHNFQPLLTSKGPRIGTINWTDPSEPSGSNNNSTWNSKSKEIEDHNYVASNTIGLLNNQTYSSSSNLIRWDPSSTLSLSQSGGLNPHHHQQQQQQHQEDNNFHNLANSSGGIGIAQSYFPSYFNFNFQMLNSNSVTPTIDTSASSQQGRPFHMSATTTNFLPTPEDRGNGLANNEGHFRSR